MLARARGVKWRRCAGAATLRGVADQFSPMAGRAPSPWDAPRIGRVLVPGAAELDDIPVALKADRDCGVTVVYVDVPRAHASLTVGAADPGTALVKFESVKGGADGNNLRVAVVRSGTGAVPSFEFSRKLLTITIGAAVELTAQALVDAFNLQSEALREVFELSLPAGSGAGNVAAAAAANLAGGGLGVTTPETLLKGVLSPMQVRAVSAVAPQEAKLTAYYPTSIEAARAVR